MLTIKFQSTRPSRASTSNLFGPFNLFFYFNPQGPRGPRPGVLCHKPIINEFQSTRPSRASTLFVIFLYPYWLNFNPQGPRGPRHRRSLFRFYLADFNPQGPRGPRPFMQVWNAEGYGFQSTRPSRASTNIFLLCLRNTGISIHKALAGLDMNLFLSLGDICNFNPQGPRGPRQTR